MFKLPENWTPEKDKMENELDILIENDLSEEEQDADLQQYHLLAKQGLA